MNTKKETGTKAASTRTTTTGKSNGKIMNSLHNGTNKQNSTQKKTTANSK